MTSVLNRLVLTTRSPVRRFGRLPGLCRGDNAPTAANDGTATAALVRGSDMARLRYVANLLPGYGIDFTPTGFDMPMVEEAAYIAASAAV